MKQIRNLFLFPLITLLVLSSLVGCTKNELNSNNLDRMELTPLVALGTSRVEASSAEQTKAAVSGSEELSLYFARADETAASTYGAYQAPSLLATRVAGVGEQPLTFNPAQYYTADGLNTKLTGWHPGGATAAGDVSGKGYYDGIAHTVSWTINGQQDVMTAPMQQGSWTSIMPALTFDHRLTQLQFFPYADTQSAVDAWGKIAKIEVLNQQNTVIYTLTSDATGEVSFSGDPTHTFSAGIAAGGASLSLSTAADKATNAKQMGNPVMIVPQRAADYTLTLRITTANNKYKEVTLTQALVAGVPYRLYLKFAGQSITIETTVAPWGSVTTTDKIGEMRIGDYFNGTKAKVLIVAS